MCFWIQDRALTHDIRLLGRDYSPETTQLTFHVRGSKMYQVLYNADNQWFARVEQTPLNKVASITSSSFFLTGHVRVRIINVGKSSANTFTSFRTARANAMSLDHHWK
jgi:hypothetical protein